MKKSKKKQASNDSVKSSQHSKGTVSLDSTKKQADGESDVTREMWLSLVQNIPNVILNVDRDGKIITINRTLIDVEVKDMIGQSAYDKVAPDYRAKFKKNLKRCFSTGKESTFEVLAIGAEGPCTAWYETHIIPIKNESEVVSAMIINTDITARKQADEAIRKSEKEYKSLFNNALIGIITTNAKTKITAINELGYKMLGYLSREDVIDKLVMADICVLPTARNEISKILSEKCELTDYETQFKRADGTTFWCEVSARYYPDEEKVESTFIDISKRKDAEERIHSLTYYDQLTKLPNKDLFKSYIESEIQKANKKRRGGIFAVMCLGINKFKNINNVYGTDMGDSMLKKVAQRLEGSVYEKDKVSRFDGDKFMILFSEIASRDDAGGLVKKIDDVFSEPFIINNIKFQINASMGVCLYPVDGSTAELLLENSEATMYMAKERGISSLFFDAQLNTQVMKRLQLERELIKAIDKSEFIAHYQPRVVSDGSIVGMESLIRWQSPKRGLVPPLEFIPHMERNGMIVDIGKFILHQSCIQNKQWQEMGYESMRVSVNLSVYQFSQPDLVNTIVKILKETGLNPKWLELEITESGIMENEKDSIEKLNEIQKIGISVSIDDFGTGYSSLSKLKDYPIDTLKIDKSFIDHIPSDTNSATIVTTIIDLAHNLGFNVVAEGVEKKEQVDFLITHGCDHFQGYYFSKPLPSKKFEEFIN